MLWNKLIGMQSVVLRNIVTLCRRCQIYRVRSWEREQGAWPRTHHQAPPSWQLPRRCSLSTPSRLRTRQFWSSRSVCRFWPLEFRRSLATPARQRGAVSTFECRCRGCCACASTICNRAWKPWSTSDRQRRVFGRNRNVDGAPTFSFAGTFYCIFYNRNAPDRDWRL